MFEALIVRPLLNILFFFYAVTPGHDFGVAVILLTAAVRLILWPLAAKQLHSQKAMTAIQPEVKKIQEKYKSDPQKMNAAVMELYKEKEVSPFSSCLPLILQLPILFGFFYVFRKFGNPAFLQMNSSGILSQIYPFVQNIAPVKAFIAANSVVNTTFFGLVDLAKPNLILGVIAGALQFVQSKMLMPKTQEKDAASAITTQMTYLFPVLTVFIAATLPSALPLYWTVTTLFAILQQYLVMHRDVETLENTNVTKPSKKS
jgi:YidC/Oxa1 family membrane protein insertase